ncbi:MAG: glycosyltransferase family 39 protein [Anaerolineae bacterium]|nr:glycosyltransferase family 39 protein [Anaerolineae bacterium]
MFKSGLPKLINKNMLTNLVIILIFITGFGIRLYDLMDPPLDFHLTRQLRSAIIARAVYYQNEANLPAEMVKQASNLASLEIYEPPIFENLVGWTYVLIGSEQVWIARIYLAIFWLIGGLVLWRILKRYTSTAGILVSLSFYFFLPYSIVASRSFQPDPWMVMWILVSIFTLMKWSEKRSWPWALAAGLCGMMALLVKIVSACFIGPMAILLVLNTTGWKKWWSDLQVWLMAGLMVIPSLLYYFVFNTQRSGDFMSFWSGSLYSMIFSTGFYADWLAMIQSLTNIFPFMLGLLGLCLVKGRMRQGLLGVWTGYFIYGLVFPYQYLTHEYYHLPLIALIALTLGTVMDAFWEKMKTQPRIWRVGVVFILFFAAFYGLYVGRSVLYANNYEKEPAAWQKIGEAIPADKTFVALTADYGMRLRYYGWRTMSAGWPTSSDERLFSLAGKGGIDNYESYFNNFIAGKDLFVILAFNEFDNQTQLKELLTGRYPVFAQGDGYLIFDLKHPIK